MDKNTDGRIVVLTDRTFRNLQQTWTVKDLAESIKLSESHIQKLFKDTTGMPPIKYVMHLRLEKAAELLTDRRFLQIQEICQEVGIIDESHFAKDFKQKYGVTPTQYRKDYWNNYNAETEMA